MTASSNRSPKRPVYRRREPVAVAAPLGISRNGERPAGLEKGLEAGEDLRPAFLHRLQRGAALGKLVVGHGELAYHAHRLDLVSHARGPVLDELRLEGMHQLLSRNDLDHDAFHARERSWCIPSSRSSS